MPCSSSDRHPQRRLRPRMRRVGRRDRRAGRGGLSPSSASGPMATACRADSTPAVSGSASPSPALVIEPDILWWTNPSSALDRICASRSRSTARAPSPHQRHHRLRHSRSGGAVLSDTIALMDRGRIVLARQRISGFYDEPFRRELPRRVQLLPAPSGQARSGLSRKTSSASRAETDIRASTGCSARRSSPGPAIVSPLTVAGLN